MSSTAVVHPIADLQKRVSKQFSAAIAAGDAFYYDSSSTLVADDSTGTQVEFVITCVPALARKDQESGARRKEGQSGDGASSSSSSAGGGGEGNEGKKPCDVFAPPYIPNLLVKELDDFTVLLNKFAVLPRHFLLVTRDFVSQDLPPSPRMLALAYRILLSYPATRTTELMAFYNCGANSGASQAHQHVQFIAVGRPAKEKKQPNGAAEQEEEDEVEDDEVDELEERANVPIEALLERIERDGREEEHIHALPVPWQHFVRLIKPPKVPTSSSTPKEQQEAKLAALEGYMAQRLMSLIDAQFQSRRVEEEPEEGGGGSSSGKPSFNLLLSRRAFHLIPRKQGEVRIPLKGKADDAAKEDDASGKATTDVSVNALGYAGLLLARSQEEVESIRDVEGGVVGILSRAGRKPVPDDSWSSA
ncbi:hypothetical protein V8E36_000109 [Tilletia maclaganii]